MKPLHPPSSSRPGRFPGRRRTATAAGWLFFLVLGCTSLPLSAAGPSPLKETLARTRAVAFVRVTKITESLQGDNVCHCVTFALCGRAAGLGEAKAFDIRFTTPSTREKREEQPAAEPMPTVGHKCVLLLTKHEDDWEILLSLKVTDEGRLAETNTGEDIGLQPGMEADAAVQLVGAKLIPQAQKPLQKPLPTARNQPWNLMRSSPLRRVWPFFPH